MAFSSLDWEIWSTLWLNVLRIYFRESLQQWTTLSSPLTISMCFTHSLPSSSLTDICLLWRQSWTSRRHQLCCWLRSCKDTSRRIRDWMTKCSKSRRSWFRFTVMRRSKAVRLRCFKENLVSVFLRKSWIGLSRTMTRLLMSSMTQETSLEE